MVKPTPQEIEARVMIYAIAKLTGIEIAEESEDVRVEAPDGMQFKACESDGSGPNVYHEDSYVRLIKALKEDLLPLEIRKD